MSGSLVAKWTPVIAKAIGQDFCKNVLGSRMLQVLEMSRSSRY